MTDNLKGRDRATWQARAAALAIEGRALIDGRRVASLGGRAVDDVSPIEGRVVAAVARCGAAEVDAPVAAAVWTSDINAAHRLSSALRGGTVWVNTYDRASLATPFGGFKQSGFGRDRSVHAIDKYVDLETIWTAYR